MFPIRSTRSQKHRRPLSTFLEKIKKVCSVEKLMNVKSCHIYLLDHVGEKGWYLLLLWLNWICICGSRTASKCQRFKWSSSKRERVLMTDGWGGRAIPQHKLIPPLHKQRQGIVGFSDSRNEILLPVCYAIKAMQHQPTETWVKAVVLLETIDFENYLLLLILTQVCERVGMLWALQFMS